MNDMNIVVGMDCMVSITSWVRRQQCAAGPAAPPPRDRAELTGYGPHGTREECDKYTNHPCDLQLGYTRMISFNTVTISLFLGIKYP